MSIQWFAEGDCVPDQEPRVEGVDYIRMMTRRGVIREIHPAQVAAKLRDGWEVVAK